MLLITFRSKYSKVVGYKAEVKTNTCILIWNTILNFFLKSGELYTFTFVFYKQIGNCCFDSKMLIFICSLWNAELYGHRQSSDITCTLNSLLLFPPPVKATQWCPDAEMNLEAHRLLLKAREKLLDSFSYFKKFTVPVVEMQNATNYFVNFWSYSTLQSIWICQRMQAK